MHARVQVALAQCRIKPLHFSCQNQPKLAGRPTLTCRVQQDGNEGRASPPEAMTGHQNQDAPVRSSSYYAGLLRSDIRTTNEASSSDMLLRSLQLAGGIAVLLAILTAGFLASNHLI